MQNTTNAIRYVNQVISGIDQRGRNQCDPYWLGGINALCIVFENKVLCAGQ